MARYAEWYAVELDGYLKGRVSDVQRFEAVKEVSNHFSEHVEELISKGMDPLEAERVAIKSFGTPRKAAINLASDGHRPSIGKYLSIGGCLAMLVAIAVVGINYNGIFRMVPDFTFGEFSIKMWTNSLVIMTITLILGVLISKKVPYRMMFGSWLVGVCIVGLNFTMRHDQDFAGVPPQKLASSMKAWHAVKDATLKVASIEQLILGKEFVGYYGREWTEAEKANSIEHIKNDAPKLLAIRPNFVEVVGKQTSGYLGAPSEDKEFYQARNFEGTTLSTGEYVGQWFPRYAVKLQYFETGEEARASWQEQSRRSISPMDYVLLAQEQSQFIAAATKFNAMNRIQLFASGVGPFTCITLGIVICMMFIGWLLTMIPNLTIRSSFQRRIA